LFQIASFYLIYRALIETSLTKPQEILFRKLKQHEEELTENLQQLDDTNIKLKHEIAERRQAEEAVRESEERYHNLFNTMDEGFCVIEMIFDGEDRPVDYRFLEVNAAFEKQTGLYDVKDKLIRDLVSDNEEYWFEIYGKIALTGESLHFGNEAKALNRWYDVHAYRVGKPENRLVAIIFNDITDRKRAEEALRTAHDELELRVQERTAELRRQADLLDLAHDAIIVRDMDGKISFWSRGAEAIYGFTKQEAIGKIIHTLLQSGFPVPLAEIIEIANRHGRWEGELTHVCKEGREITVLSRWSVRKGKADGTVEIMEINQDITKRRQAEEAHRRVNAYNRSLIEASLDPLVTIDRAGKISDVNSATERITGHSREKLIGTDFTDYCTDSERAKVGYLLVFQNEAVKDYELEILHRDGHTTPVLYNASVYREKDGKAVGVFAAARDITQRRKLEDRLRQSQKMEAIGTLAGGIAHDFNNMLAAIIGFTEMALEDVPDRPDVERSLQNVSRAAMRARDLVKQILAFSRKTSHERNPLSLLPLVKETIQLLRASIPTTIEIKFTATATSDTILAAPAEIQQILMNLATNASLAMQEKGGTMEVSLTDIDFEPDSPVFGADVSPGEYVQLMVKDTGIGMGPDVMKRVFDPFFTTREVGKGTGMGLAVVYGIVKDLQGAVTVESELGVGSTFSVLLPKVKTDAQAEAVKTIEVPGGTERILFVDDEEMLIEWGRATLEKLGYKVTAMIDSTEALKTFLNDPSRFDLVITDHAMPQMAGSQLSKELLTIKPDTPIILCTGHSDNISPEIARKIGIREFLMKPVTRQELAQAVRRVLDTTIDR
jgi:PAS domain S-box-containing protein